MDRNQWRSVSQVSENSNKSILISDSDDEIPGSRNASDSEEESGLKRDSISMSRTSKPIQ